MKCRINFMASALSIEPDQHAAQANPDRHFSSPGGFMFQESLLYTSIPLRRNVSARISLRRLRKLIRVDTLRRGHTFQFYHGGSILNHGPWLTYNTKIGCALSKGIQHCPWLTNTASLGFFLYLRGTLHCHWAT